MKKSVPLLLIAILFSAAASAIDPSKLASAKMKFSSKGMFEKEISVADYKLSYVTVNLTTYPRSNRWQTVSSEKTRPPAELMEDFALFKWETFEGNLFDFQYEAEVTTNTGTMFVDKRVHFPNSEYPKEYELYTQPSETIDSDDPRIVQLANSLAEGEDDQFIVVFKMADWIIQNINYNLSSMTVEVSQKASWVLENRYGVCDEITTLFLAMCRSLGIPARFITGTAYTNYAGANEWGNHAWSEIYFPGVGWVPYDLTYKQIGYTDGSHITLQHSLDANYIFTKYRWLGRGVDIKTYGLDMNTTLVSAIKYLEPKEIIEVSFLKERTDFDSYNALVVDLKNPSNVYITSELYLAQSTGYEYLNSSKHNVMLRPKETKTLYFPLKLTEEFQKNYEYTFFGGVSTPQNNSKESSFKVLENDPYYSLEDINTLIDQKTKERTKNFTASIGLLCKPKEPEILQGNQADIECEVSNMGNVEIKNLEVCLEDCKSISLSISKSKTIQFSKILEDVGSTELIVRASNDQVAASDSAFIDVLEQPKIEIKELNYPKTAEFTDAIKISFVISKASFAKPKNIRIFIDGTQVFDTTTELENSKRYTINTHAKNLPGIQSLMQLDIQYEDIKGNQFLESDTLSIRIVNLTPWQRLTMLFNKSPMAASSIIGAIFVFFITVVYIFYRGAKNLIFGKRDKGIITSIDQYENKKSDQDLESNENENRN